MTLTRSSGILLHPTSLPGPFGIGDLGPSAHRFLEFLRTAGQSIWQVLPLGPTGYGDSPYQSFSSFAGNPLLISPEALREDGYLENSDLEGLPALPAERVDFGAVIDLKRGLLERAFGRFRGGADYDAFQARQAGWLEDYALFAALKDAHAGASWTDWEPELVRRKPDALAGRRDRLRHEIDRVKFAQFVFFRQWQALRAAAHSQGVRLVGDVPIFVAHDSADVWASPHLFHLNENGQPTIVAGVPPDYFSATGQLWGNPLYRWGVLAASDYAWWIERLRAVLGLVDLVRLDHFRGFEAYWAIPTPAETAIVGSWEPGPSAALFFALQDAFGAPLPIIAEDLGVITPAVEALRDMFKLPGMRIMQFAFTADTKSAFLPHNYERHTVAYSGTHDNDTTVGWFAKLDEATRARVLRYTGTDGSEIHWDVIRLLLVSVADAVVFPLQDVLGLGDEARMNVPGSASGNWGWRTREGELSPALAERLAGMVAAYDRLPGTAAAPD
jgi:4-alpha-glucanotransferase